MDSLSTNTFFKARCCRNLTKLQSLCWVETQSQLLEIKRSLLLSCLTCNVIPSFIRRRSLKIRISSSFPVERDVIKHELNKLYD